MTNKIKFLKWLGSKEKQLKFIKEQIHTETRYYCEPFLGGGSLALSLDIESGLLGDVNHHLMLTWFVLKHQPLALFRDCHRLLLVFNQEDLYYELRSVFNHHTDLDFSLNEATLTRHQWHICINRAALFIYLNKVGYRGIWRVNKQGKYNVPYGNYISPSIGNVEQFVTWSKRLANYQLVETPFEETVLSFCRSYKNKSPKTKLVYLDPPYDKITATSFVDYTTKQNDLQEKVFQVCETLDAQHVPFILSNAHTPYILDRYKAFKIYPIEAKRGLPTKQKGYRASEVLITNQ